MKLTQGGVFPQGYNPDFAGLNRLLQINGEVHHAWVNYGIGLIAYVVVSLDFKGPDLHTQARKAGGKIGLFAIKKYGLIVDVLKGAIGHCADKEIYRIAYVIGYSGRALIGFCCFLARYLSKGGRAG